jgi:hypothetical protein
LNDNANVLHPCVNGLTDGALPRWHRRGIETAMTNRRESRMDTIVKSVVTAALAIVIAWPLLFWGEPALPDGEIVRRPQHALTWAVGWSLDQQAAEYLVAW